MFPLFKLVVIVQVLENAALKFLLFATLQESRLDALHTFTCSYYIVFKLWHIILDILCDVAWE